MAEQESVIFELTDALEYTNTKTGKKEETLEIEMFGPTYDTAKLTFKLAQYFMKAIVDQATGKSGEELERAEKEKKPDHDISIEEIKGLMFSSDIPFDKLLDMFVTFSNKICFLDSDKKIPLTKTLMRRINFYDQVDMVCSYMANFIAPFALSTK